MTTTTEEIVVSGEDFIERRIFLCPEETDLAGILQSAYSSGYKRGCLSGLLTSAVFFIVAAACIWLIVG